MERLCNTEFTERDVSRYCAQLLRGLQWCHSKGVVHRDLK